MRTRATAVVLVALVALAALVSPGGAQPRRLSLQLEAPTTIRPGDRAALVLTISPAGDQAFLITPRSEGQAITVARGRLQRSDGEAEGDSLVVPIPIIAQGPGHALVRVHVQTYVCEGAQCELREEEAQVAVDVVRAP